MQLVSYSSSSLSNERDKIIWNTKWKFSNQGTLVCSSRIEIPQGDCLNASFTLLKSSMISSPICLVLEEQLTGVRLFCQLLYYTGVRIAEIHNLTRGGIDVSNGTVVIESLKKRWRGIYREIPIPDFLLEDLGAFIEKRQIRTGECLWPFSLRTASRQISRVMKAANIRGIRGCAKGLRHGFAVNAVTKAPLTMVKKWLGHGTLETTEVYLNIVGAK